jgi:hypothetical protein
MPHQLDEASLHLQVREIVTFLKLNLTSGGDPRTAFAPQKAAA